jgi:hypothetical protein
MIIFEHYVGFVSSLMKRRLLIPLTETVAIQEDSLRVTFGLHERGIRLTIYDGLSWFFLSIKKHDEVYGVLSQTWELAMEGVLRKADEGRGRLDEAKSIFMMKQYNSSHGILLCFIVFYCVLLCFIYFF